jgi:4-azaleucine resistance transporter AzlC
VSSTGKGAFFRALAFTVPVFLGYISIGFGFGILLVKSGYPWQLSVLMGILMYAGAGQYLAVGLFAAGASLWEAVFLQLVLNIRHMAYGLSMLRRFGGTGRYKPYLIYALTDETFALLSSLEDKVQPRFMFYIAILDQSYWVLGSFLGGIAGTLLPFSMDGVEFALTALFLVLMIEQYLRVKRPGLFLLSAGLSVLGALLLPARVSLLSALVLSLAFTQIFFSADLSGEGEMRC